MSTDNVSLEVMVEKTLESSGLLPKMRAELRANVFRILEKGSSFENKLYTDKIKDFVSNKNGLLLLSLVRDLLDYLELTFTTSVFDPETGAGLKYQYIEKNDIFQELTFLKEDKRPLLLQILEILQSHSKSKSTDNTNMENFSSQHNGHTFEGSPPGSPLLQILKSNEESTKSTLDCKSKSISPVKTYAFETEIFHPTNLESLSSSNFNLTDNVQINDVDRSESSNSLSIGELSPDKQTPIERYENTDEDVNSVKSDLKCSKNESSLEDVETDENISCGNDSQARRRRRTKKIKVFWKFPCKGPKLYLTLIYHIWFMLAIQILIKTSKISIKGRITTMQQY